MSKKKKKIINSSFRSKEVWAVALFVSAIIIFLSIIGFTGEVYAGLSGKPEHFLNTVGVVISEVLVYKMLGYFSIIIPIIMSIIAYAIFFKKTIKYYIIKSVHLFIITLSIAILFHTNEYIVGPFPYSTGKFLYEFLNLYGKYPLFYAFIPLFTIILIASFVNIALSDLFMVIAKKFRSTFQILSKILSSTVKFINMKLDRFKDFKANKKLKIEVSKPQEVINEKSEDKLENHVVEENIEEKPISNEPSTTNLEDVNEKEYSSESDEPLSITIEDQVKVEQGDLDKHESRKSKYRNYKLPLTEFMVEPVEISNTIDENLLREKAQELVHALETFGVKSKVRKISPGPIITLFEIEPDEGVRVNKFTNLSDDLARVMAAQRIRVIAPIPGTTSVGIELPNENPSIVYLKTIINSERFINKSSKLTIGLGKTTTGDAYTFDLADMPHLLVAGATGAGKSVCINTIIISILYKAKPDEVKFIMIDPKKLELATYKSLVGYHLITAPNLDEYVMTTADNAVGILTSAITEMERRFQVFSDARVRHISEYHDRCSEDSQLENIPYIVVLIDELADLMMTSGRAVEEPITRLAQKARAVGIHLVVATQRPSVDVITGLIKSNFPARISFQVSSKIDSRTILDQMGAEKLLGKGDMLFLLPGSASPIRLHNAFIQLKEIEDIMSHIENQPRPEELHLPEIIKLSNNGNVSVDNVFDDELLKEAAYIIVNNQQASVSLLQRKLRVGYSRAGRLIDELESLGIISGHNGSKPRDVLEDRSRIDDIFSQ